MNKSKCYINTILIEYNFINSTLLMNQIRYTLVLIKFCLIDSVIELTKLLR